jgi:hypothetical protein
MKKKLFLLGTLAMALAFGLVLAGCDNGSDEEGGGGGGDGAPPATEGKITITSVPSTNFGKYAYVFTQVGDDELWGGSNWAGNTLHGVEITSDNAASLEIPIWKSVSHAPESYNGSGSATYGVSLYITSSASVSGSNWQGGLGTTTKTFSSVTFARGKLTVAW